VKLIAPFRIALLLAFAVIASATWAQSSDPLSSWNDGEAKSRIVKFVQAVTDNASKDHVPASDRIAVFDNDGTLWSEQPMYFQLAFAIDRVKVLAPKHPEWKARQPFKAALEGDAKAAALDCISDHLMPGRRGEAREPNAKELAATLVLALPLDEASVKVSAGDPADDPGDLDRPVWAGVVPLAESFGAPVDAPDLRGGHSIPDYVLAWRR